MRSLARLLLLAVLALGLIAAGCGGGDDEPTTQATTAAAPPAAPPPGTAGTVSDVITVTLPTESGPGTSTVPTTPATTDSSTSATAPTAPTPPSSPATPPSEARLRQALLVEDDFGDGWDGDVTDASAVDDEICGVSLGTGAAAQASARFSADDDSAVAGHRIGAYTTADADRVMREAAQELDGCDLGGSSGATTKLAATGRPAGIGDDALAFTVTVQSDDEQAAGEMVLIRRGDLVGVLLYLKDGTVVDRAVLDPLLREADQRLRVVAGP